MIRAMDGDERRAAALRLKHDLGKAIRFNAPAAPEADVEALRERLRLDLVVTRLTPEGVRSAVEVWDAWHDAHGEDFMEEASSYLLAISLPMEVFRREVPRLDKLDRAALRQLDDLTRVVQEMIFRMTKELMKG